MAVLTESMLRSQILKDKLQGPVLKLPQGTVLTPSAKSYLQEKKITIEFAGSKESVSEEKYERPWNFPEKKQKQAESPLKYRLIQGGFIDEKPEHLTSLHTNLLVYKDHKRIIFRGKLDSLEAKIIDAQLKVSESGLISLAEDLQEMLEFVRTILRAEVLGEELTAFRLLNMEEKEIREKSHHPEKYFGSGHFYPDYRMGEGIVLLNGIRTITRETELAAYQAFKQEDGSSERDDIILALNRLSSLCWVMMFKYKTGDYKKDKRGDGGGDPR